MAYTFRPDLDYFTQQSALSSPGRYAGCFNGLPRDIHTLCEVIQGFLLHAFWISEDNYGVSVDALKCQRSLNAEYNLRAVEDMLGALLTLDARPLTERRLPDLRLIGNCRDFALFLTAILRYQGIPARVRSGVARYFYTDGHLEDHFITEWWNTAEERWQQYTDPQIDDLQKKTCIISIDTTDLPRDQFLHAGLGYTELIDGRVAPDKIGIFQFNGMPYVRYKLVSDLACLNKVEVLAWEGWGIVEDIGQPQLDSQDQSLLDRIAALLRRYDTDVGAFAELTALFNSHPRLRLPINYSPHFFELPQFK